MFNSCAQDPPWMNEYKPCLADSREFLHQNSTHIRKSQFATSRKFKLPQLAPKDFLHERMIPLKRMQMHREISSVNRVSHPRSETDPRCEKTTLLVSHEGWRLLPTYSRTSTPVTGVRYHSSALPDRPFCGQRRWPFPLHLASEDWITSTGAYAVVSVSAMRARTAKPTHTENCDIQD